MFLNQGRDGLGESTDKIGVFLLGCYNPAKQRGKRYAREAVEESKKADGIGILAIQNECHNLNAVKTFIYGGDGNENRW